MKHFYLSLFCIGFCLPLRSAVWYVATNGNDGNSGSLSAPFKSLTTAIEAAAPGDIIEMRGGVYQSEEIRINKNNLTIRSYPNEWAVIKAVTDVEDISACLWYNEPETIGGTLERLEITGGYYYAIKFETNWDWDNAVPFSQRRGVSQVTIKDCVIHHSGRDAIKLTPACDRISILNCEIHHTGVGPGALLDFNAEGIDNVNAPNLLVKNCYIHDIATTGVYVKGGGRNCIIEANRIENCGEGGIYLGFYTDAEWFDTDFNPTYFENINGLAINNLIVNTQHAGIGLWGAKDAQIYNNTVINAAQAEHAALFFNTTDVWIDDNNAARTASQNVQIRNNIFVQSADQMLTMVRVRENALSGNATLIDNNLYYDPNGALFLDDNLDWQEWSFAQWKAQTFRDLHGYEANPLLTTSGRLQQGSPCINTGANLALVLLDREGQLRNDGATDIGSDELGGATGLQMPELSEGIALRLQENPFDNVLTLIVNNPAPGSLPFIVSNASGVVMYQEHLELPSGKSTLRQQTMGWEPGVYFISLGGTCLKSLKL